MTGKANRLRQETRAAGAIIIVLAGAAYLATATCLALRRRLR